MRLVTGLVLLLLLCVPGTAVAATVNQTGYWTFDEGAGSVAADSAGGHTATLSGGAGWAPGYRGYALSLNGTTAYADAGAPVVDTARSFTVSARVKLDRVVGYQTMVSVDGAQASGFFLQSRGAEGGRFTLAKLPADSPVHGVPYPLSTTVPVVGQWYMVTGVYDLDASTLTIYVDNRRESVTVAPAPWKAGGHLVFGRSLYGQFTDFVDGAIDDVRTFDGALTATQVAELFSTGSFRVLVDDDGDNTAVPADCDDHNAAIHPGAIDIPGDGIDQDCSGADALPDKDGDGVPLGLDCDDGAAAVHPGAAEVPGNGVDENCDGVAALATVAATVRSDWTATARSTRVNTLLVRGAPRDATIETRCSGGGCPFKLRRVRAPSGGNVNVRAPLRNRRLRVGAILEIRISAPFSVAKVARFTMRKRRSPLTTYFCLPPGAKQPARCP